MHLKWFKGRAFTDVMRRVREELGPEAVILHSRSVHPWGPLRLLGGSRVEILAAGDRPEAPATQAMPHIPPAAPSSLHGLRSQPAAPRRAFLPAAGGGPLPAPPGPPLQALPPGCPGPSPALA